MPARRCPECDFDLSDWTPDDLDALVRKARSLWNLVVDGAGENAELKPLADAIEGASRADPHVVVHSLRAAGRVVHAGAATRTGTVATLHASGGGVPKPAVPALVVGRLGARGDVQADRRNHGRPFQALCLWAVEVIADLAAEGHPIRPGAAGENVTVSGLDWAALVPGMRVRFGSEVLAEVSAYTTPCKKNARWFVGGDFLRMSHVRHPGSSRLYAWVLRGGTIRPGDPVVVEP